MVLLQSNSVNKSFSLPSFELPNSLGGSFRSVDLAKDIVLVAFICNHCPYVQRIADQFSQIAKKWQEQVETVAISANDPDYNTEDSFDNMSIFAKQYGFCFPYLYDESQSIAKNFKAVCTPDLFVFKKINGQYLHRYRGRIDDLERVYADLVSSDDVSFEQIPSAGCSIKWRANRI